MRGLIFFKALVLFMTFVSFNLYSTELVTNIARKMKYYDLVQDLHLKSNEHFRQLHYKLDQQIQSLRNQGRYRAADKMLIEFDKALHFHIDEVKSTFDRISYILVLGGYKLDRQETSVKEKIRFVEHLRDRLVHLINNLIKKDLKDIESMIYVH